MGFPGEKCIGFLDRWIAETKLVVVVVAVADVRGPLGDLVPCAAPLDWLLHDSWSGFGLDRLVISLVGVVLSLRDGRLWL